MKRLLQCLFGIAVIAAAACMWKYWNADGAIMAIMGAAGIWVSVDSFQR